MLPSPPARRLPVIVSLFILTRTVMNVGYRMVYPFLPALARGVGVDVTLVAHAVTARNALGIAGPLLGSLGDVRGRRTGMMVGLALFVGGLLLVVAWPTYPALFASLMLVSASKIVFEPAMLAYLGDRVAYERRGLVLGLVELAWSSSVLFGMPIAGWLIARGGWTAPFLPLALLGAAALIILWRILPPDNPAHNNSAATALAGIRSALGHGQVLAGLAFVMLICVSIELISIVYGVWMEGSFGLRVAALGAASALFGLAELGGEGLVAGFTDRIGKRRSAALGAALFAVSCVVLPLIGGTLAGALVGLFLFFITFEFTLVSWLTLMTELVPGARAALLAANISAISAGHMLGAIAGPLLFRFGMGANGGAAMVITLVALVLLLRFVRMK